MVPQVTRPSPYEAFRVEISWCANTMQLKWFPAIQCLLKVSNLPFAYWHPCGNSSETSKCHLNAFFIAVPSFS